MEYLIGLIGVLLGMLFYTNTKKKSAEALLENLKMNKDLNKEDQSISKNNGLLDAEEQKRKEAQDEKDSLDALNRFFNDK